MSNENINKRYDSSAVTSRGNVMKNRKKSDKTNDNTSTGICLIIFMLTIVFLCATIEYSKHSVGALYFGMCVLLVAILLYVIPGVIYITARCRIKREIILKHGVMNGFVLKERMREDRYGRWFIRVNASLFAVLCMGMVLVLLIVLWFFVGGGDNPFFVVKSIFSWPCYFVTDFFTMDTEQVTYIGESEYIYTRTSKTTKYAGTKTTKIYSYCVVNFQTSGGDLLSLIVDKDNLAEVRSYSNTEIKYIPRTKIYVP